MKIDLRKLYASNSLPINEDIQIPADMYEKMGVLKMDTVSVNGIVSVNYDDNIELNLHLKGSFVMPCAITGDEVNVPFECQIEDEISENSLNNNFFLDLLDILWENIILEIPIRVIKEGAVTKHLKGDGWEVAGE